MSVTYNEIQEIIFNNEFAELIPDGMILSEPVASKKNKKVIDNFFVMRRGGAFAVPVYKFGVCIKDKTIEYVEEYKEVNIPKAQKSEGLTLEEYREYTSLYGEVRGMFAGELPADKEKLGKYLTYFFKLVDKHLLAFYNELSPMFFVFLRESLL